MSFREAHIVWEGEGMYARQYEEEVKRLARRVHEGEIDLFGATHALVQYSEGEYPPSDAMVLVNRALALHIMQVHLRHRVADEGPQAD